MRQYLPSLIVFLIRLLVLTVRVKLTDLSGITRGMIKHPVIWCVWHNRILISPIAYQRFCWERKVCVLTSRSKDGAILAGVMAKVGASSVRGSSSQGGGAALRELVQVIKNKADVVITPDGPRGPVYSLNPGIIKLAQISGCPILPVYITYSRYWELRSWDRFRIPKPFSKVDIVYGTLVSIPAELDAEAFEGERLRLENLLLEEPLPSEAAVS